MKKWEIMKAFEEGAEIESRNISVMKQYGWYADDCPQWNWGSKDYRVKQSKWQPSEQGNHYITSDKQFGDYPSEKHVDFGVVFNTLKEAEEASVVFRQFHRLYQLALELNEGWTPDWDDDNQNKYFIEYDHLSKEWDIDYVANYQALNSIFFQIKRNCHTRHSNG